MPASLRWTRRPLMLTTRSRFRSSNCWSMRKPVAEARMRALQQASRTTTGRGPAARSEATSGVIDGWFAVVGALGSEDAGIDERVDRVGNGAAATIGPDD